MCTATHTLPAQTDVSQLFSVLRTEEAILRQNYKEQGVEMHFRDFPSALMSAVVSMENSNKLP